MSDNILHEKLITKQTTLELKRKKDKAERKDIFTQEDLDLAKRRASEYYKLIKWE